MPHLKINTTLSPEDFDDEFLKELTSTLAALCGKPEKYVFIEVSGGKKMFFGGTPGPAAYCTFSSIGKIDEEKNSTYAATIFKAINAKGVPSDRMYIEFRDLARENTAWNNKLFSQ